MYTRTRTITPETGIQIDYCDYYIEGTSDSTKNQYEDFSGEFFYFLETTSAAVTPPSNMIQLYKS